MPREVKTKEEFKKLLEGAAEVRVVKVGDSAKVKVRREESLYTFKTSSDDADAILKGTKVPVVEV